jgi:PPOX class probable F420-dependent enzyme
MSFEWDEEHRAFLDAHKWAILATGRADGSPQQSMVAYAVDDEGRLLISAKAFTAKWKNACRQARVSVAISDDRVHLVVYGEAETIDADPDRAALTAQVFGVLSGSEPPEPDAIVPMLDEQQRTVIRVTPDKTFYQE